MRVGDRYFGRYWVQILRFLARSKLLGQKQIEITSDRQRYPRGQAVRFQVRFLNPSLGQDLKTVSLRVQGPNGADRTVTLGPAAGAASPGLFEGTLNGLTEGKYRVQFLPPPVLPGDPPALEFQVTPPAREFVKIELNREELTSAAKLTGGTFFRWDDETQAVDARSSVPRVSTGIDPESVGKEGEIATSRVEKTLAELLPPPEKVPLDSDPPIALWNTWPAFLAFLVLLTLEWLIRKRMQLA